MHMNRPRHPHAAIIRQRRPAARMAGMTPLSVLVAVVVLGLGILSIGKVYASLTVATTQNQNISTLGPLSDAFWGVIQANPALLTSVAGSYTSATIDSAPAALHNWLGQVTATLPQSTVTITTGADAASGSACSVTNGCTVRVSITWAQSAVLSDASASAPTRVQTFYYQFGF